MTEPAVLVRITPSSEAASVLTFQGPFDEIGSLIVRLGSNADTQVVIEAPPYGELIVGLDKGRATLGLDVRDGLYQLSVKTPDPGHSVLTIGGQPTEIERQFVCDLPTASQAAIAWLSHGEPPDGTTWVAC